MDTTTTATSSTYCARCGFDPCLSEDSCPWVARPVELFQYLGQQLDQLVGPIALKAPADRDTIADALEDYASLVRRGQL